MRSWHAKRQDMFFAHHFTQAMAVLFCLLSAIFGFCLFVTAECLFLTSFPNASQQIIERWGPYLRFIDYVIWPPIVVLAALWIMPAVFALCGSTRPVPLLKQLTRRTWMIRFSLFSNTLMLALAPVIAACALHASSLTRTCHKGASVYFLYDEGVGVPRWFFALGMYRISLQAESHWGKGCTVIDYLNQENLRTALTDGKVLILATHGQYGFAYTYYAPTVLAVGPADSGVKDQRNSSHFLSMSVVGKDNRYVHWENVAVSDNLQLAYIFACNGGERATEWKEHLSPAQVVTYNRVSTVYDHAYWFAIAGPAVIGHFKK